MVEILHIQSLFHKNMIQKMSFKIIIYKQYLRMAKPSLKGSAENAQKQSQIGTTQGWGLVLLVVLALEGFCAIYICLSICLPEHTKRKEPVYQDVVPISVCTVCDSSQPPVVLTGHI